MIGAPNDTGAERALEQMLSPADRKAFEEALVTLARCAKGHAPQYGYRVETLDGGDIEIVIRDRKRRGEPQDKAKGGK